MWKKIRTNSVDFLVLRCNCSIVILNRYSIYKRHYSLLNVLVASYMYIYICLHSNCNLCHSKCLSQVFKFYFVLSSIQSIPKASLLYRNTSFVYYTQLKKHLNNINRDKFLRKIILRVQYSCIYFVSIDAQFLSLVLHRYHSPTQPFRFTISHLSWICAVVKPHCSTRIKK